MHLQQLLHEYASDVNVSLCLQSVHVGVFRGDAEKCQTETSSLFDTASPQNFKPRVTKPASDASMKDRGSTSARKSSGGHSIKNTGWTCGQCLLWVPDRETYISHMKGSHGRVRPCTVNQTLGNKCIT